MRSAKLQSTSRLHLQGSTAKHAQHRLRYPRFWRPGTLRVQIVQSAVEVRDKKQPSLHTKVAIIGGGPAGHTAAIYAARAELEPIVFEGWMAGGIAPGGQLTTTTFVENFPGFVEPIMGYELTDKFRQHSERYGTRILTETITDVDLLVHDVHPLALHRRSMEDVLLGMEMEESHRPRRPFKLWTPERCVTADTVIISTGASARRLKFPGSGDESEGGFWNRGISACAICDGTSPLIRNKPVAVVGGGDSAMEEAMFLTRYASKVYVVHRFDYLEASKAMSRRALANPKIEVVWCSQVVEAHGNEQGNLGAITVLRSPHSADQHHNEVESSAKPCLQRLEVGGMFFAIGHRPATDFLKGQLELDEYGYIITVPGSTATNVPGVFAAGDVMDRTFRQAITAAGRGCMAALEAERFLHALQAIPKVTGAASEAGDGGGDGRSSTSVHTAPTVDLGFKDAGGIMAATGDV